MKPMVEEFLRGRSGMLAALGPSGSGKTHTVFGSARDPGMVPLALRHIFKDIEPHAKQASRYSCALVSNHLIYIKFKLTCTRIQCSLVFNMCCIWSAYDKFMMKRDILRARYLSTCFVSRWAVCGLMMKY